MHSTSQLNTHLKVPERRKGIYVKMGSNPCSSLFVCVRARVCECQEIQRPNGVIRETEGYIIQGTTLPLQEFGGGSFM